MRKKLKIAHAVHFLRELPPKKYGGIGAIASELVYGLAKKGHKITVFGPGRSHLKGKNITYVNGSPYPTTRSISRKWEIKQFRTLIKRQTEFDLIHLHYEPFVGQVSGSDYNKNLFSQIKIPKVYTIHDNTHIPERIKYYKKNKDKLDGFCVFISKDHREPLKFIKKSTIIYNGINENFYKYNSMPQDYMLFLGRLTKDKGIVEAIKTAKAVGSKLFVFGWVDLNHKETKTYYENKVKPLFDGKQIVYGGELPALSPKKVRYYQNAKCLLFPISWHEPFGLVMAEAMSCGTPVVGFNMGSVSEIVKNGETGYVVKNLSQMIKKTKQIEKIKRINCRKRVEKLFTIKKMIENYEDYYKKILNT